MKGILLECLKEFCIAENRKNYNAEFAEKRKNDSTFDKPKLLTYSQLS